MRIIYDKLFDVELSHAFYDSESGGGVMDDLDIRPTAACFRLLKNYGLLCKKTNSGFTVLYEAEEGPGDTLVPRRAIEDPVKFSFVAKTLTPWFVNLSQLPIPDDGPPKIYRAHNRQVNIRNGELLLTADEAAAYLSEKDRIEWKPLLFHERFETEDSSVDMQVVDERGEVVVYKKAVAVEKAVDFVVDLKNASPGKYALLKNGVETRVFYADDQLIGKKAFAVIDIFEDDTVAPAYRFIDQNHSVSPKTYKIKIDNRKAYWKYFVVKKYRDIANDNLVISLSGNEAAFARKPDVVLLDGLKATPFVSTDEIGLAAKPVKGIKLSSAGSEASDNFEIANLPNGRAETIKPDKAEDKIFSEIFIYV